jgi:release factor glutamine methyltransferase
VISRFRDLNLWTPPPVFAPRSDAGDLIDAALPLVEGDLLDVCTGSGVVALSLAPFARSTVAIDCHRLAVAAARVNALLNRRRVRVLRGDLFAPVRGRRFDCVVANPPYVPTDQDRRRPRGSTAWDGGHDGRAILDRLCHEASAYLRPGGRLLLVQSSLADQNRTLSLLASVGLQPAVATSRRGELGPIVQAQLPHLTTIGALDEEPVERIVVIEALKAP